MTRRPLFSAGRRTTSMASGTEEEGKLDEGESTRKRLMGQRPNLEMSSDGRCSSHHGGLSLAYALVTILITIALLPPSTSAGFRCLDRCDCFYKSNKLIADCNGLTSLPEESAEEQEKQVRAGIQVLNLTRNTFSELKRNIFSNAKMVNLQRIYLRQVGLEVVEKEAFNPLANLVDLDLSYNSLKSIPSEAFDPVPKLRDLDLSVNQIGEVPANGFLSLKALKTLNLERNKIKYVDIDAFAGLELLETLKLSDNQLSFLDGRCLSPLVKVHSLQLSENKWNCDCRMRQLREFLLMNPRLSVGDLPKCSSNGQTSSIGGNGNVGNKVWTQLDLNSFVCAPRIVANTSSKSVYQVEELKNLALECSFYMDEGLADQMQLLSVKWIWQNRTIGNNSEGVVKNQMFVISEFEAPLFGNSTTGKKMKVSRLEISLVLELNQGLYLCQSQNKAGSAQWNFTVVVTKGSQSSATSGLGERTLATEQQASIVTGSGHRQRFKPGHEDEDVQSNERRANEEEEDALRHRDGYGHHPDGSEVVSGLVWGIFFGVFLVLVLFSLAFMIVHRRRVHGRRNSGATDRVSAAQSEELLEKLTPATLGNSMSMSSRETVALINPVQKPPRMGFVGTPTTPTVTPQVWLVKRNNGANNSMRSDGDGCCESPLPLFEYDTATINTYTSLASNIEPDLIHHPSAFLRSHRLICNDEQISIHSDGTEV